MATARTLIDMAAQRGGAAAFDGDEHFDMRPGQSSRMPVDESLPCGTYNIGQLQEWPDHWMGLHRSFWGLRCGPQWK